MMAVTRYVFIKIREDELTEVFRSTEPVNHLFRMDFFENRYYRVARRLLILTGQWPYSSFKVKTTSRVVISLFLITLLFVQVSKLIVVGSDFYLFLEYVPFVIYAAIVHLKYFTCWINNKMVRDILELIKNDWQSLRSEAELEVLRKYTEEGRFFTKFYLCTIPASRIVE